MKKLLFAFCAAIALFTGCQNDSSDDSASVQISLKERINTARDGDVIDLGKANLKIDENDSYTISKPLTIKNGNVKNATFTVESDKVVFDSLMSINGVIVHERVGDGDFTLQNCYKVSEVYVNGGGSNSIHIAKTIVEKLIVNKKGVRVALSNDGPSKVTKTMIFEDCKLDSENENNSFEKVIVEKAVKNLNLAGKTKVERIVSTESSGSELPSIKIIVSVEVKVVAADSTVKKSIEKTDGNEEFNNKKESDIKDVKISAEEKADLEEEQEKVEKPGTSEKPGETEKPETPALENLDFIVVSKDKISEELDAFPDFAVGAISEIKVEKTSSEVIVTNSAASEDYLKIWDYWLVSKTPVEAKKGKNYKISFDLKADKSSGIYLATLDAATSEDSKYVEYNVGTEYKTYSVETGTILTDRSAEVPLLAIGSVSKLYIKNYKIEETDPKIGYAIFGSDKNDSISCEASADDISVIFGENENGNSGINIYPLALEVGKLHKVTFDVTCDKKVSDVAIFARANSNECATAGSEHFDFNTEKKTVTLYVPVYQKNNETLRTLLVWVDSETPCKLTFSNFKSVETDLNSVLEEDTTLGLYFAGDIYLSEAEGKLWRVLSADRPIQLSPGSRVEGQVLLCDYAAWDSVVTSFRVISKDSEVKRENENIVFTNNSSKTVSLSFSINDKLEAAVACAETELPDCLWIEGFVSETNATTGDYTREKFKVIDANTQKFEFKYDAEKHTGWGSKRGTIFFKVCADETGWRLSFGGTNGQELSVSLNGDYVPLYAWGVDGIYAPGNIVVKNLADAGDYVITVVGNASVGFMKLKIEGAVYEWPELPPLKTGWYYYDINKSDLGGAETFNMLFNKQNSGLKSQSADIVGLSVSKNIYWYDCWQEPDVSGSVLHGVSNPSDREDNPGAAPADGYIRIYFYSAFSGPGNLNLYYWTVEPVFATDWPGVKMNEFPAVKL